MNKFQKELLKLSYENYYKTNNRTFRFNPKNGNNLFYYTNAAEIPSNKGYIIPQSDNIHAPTINQFNVVIVFEITDKGINYITNNP